MLTQAALTFPEAKTFIPLVSKGRLMGRQSMASAFQVAVSIHTHSVFTEISSADERVRQVSSTPLLWRAHCVATTFADGRTHTHTLFSLSLRILIVSAVPAGGRSISAREEFRSKQWARAPPDKRVFNKRVSLKQHIVDYASDRVNKQ